LGLKGEKDDVAHGRTRPAKEDLRHLLYGKKPHVYRVIYQVDERRQAVWVLTVRHGARRKLKATDVE
jgi:toxin ParE1/3/4